MSPRISAKLEQPILFAHRGASALAPDNTIESFQLALRLGANGLESDIWMSADGVSIMAHDDEFGPRLRRRRISQSDAADLPEHVPTLEKFFETFGTEFQLSLDIKDPAAIGPTIDAAREASERSGSDMVSRTWLCHPDLDTVTSWRSRWSDIRLVHSTRLGRLKDGPERHASVLFDRQIDAVNLRFADWTGGLTTLYHRFGIYAFGWDAHREREATELLDMGIDALFSNYVDRMLSARQAVYKL